MSRWYKILAIVLAGSLLGACNPDSNFDKNELKNGTIRLEKGGRTLYSYDPYTSQMSFNTSNNEFRVGTDNFSDYFVLKLSSLPKREDEKITGSLVWTTSSTVESVKSISFEVKKIDTMNTIWLWNAENEFIVVVKQLL